MIVERFYYVARANEYSFTIFPPYLSVRSSDWGKQIVVGKIFRRKRDLSTQNFDLGTIFSSKVIKVNYVAVKSGNCNL
jgi:hypothetical protein